MQIFFSWASTTKINNFEITDLHMLHPCVPSNPGNRFWLKKIEMNFLWCTHVRQQKNHFHGGEFTRTYTYVKPYEKNDP